MQVEVECTIDSQDIKIVRAGNKASLWTNGALQVQSIANSQKQVNKQISNLLGDLTREQFESTYVAMQGNTAGLVEKDSKEVSPIIEKLLQLGVLTKTLEIQEKRRNAAKTSVKDQGERLNNQLKLKQEIRNLITNFQNARKLEMQIQHVQKYLKAIEQILVTLEQEIGAATQDVRNKQSSVDDWDQKRSEQKTTIERMEKEHQHNVGLQTLYQSLREKLATLEGKRNVNEEGQQKCINTIQNAQ